MFDQKNEISQALENLTLHRKWSTRQPKGQVSSPRRQCVGEMERNEGKIKKTIWNHGDELHKWPYPNPNTFQAKYLNSE